MSHAPARIRVFIADDHAIFRQGLRLLLERAPDLQVVGEAEDGRKVLQHPERASWDVLLLDLSLPKVSGIEVLRRLREELPSLAILILSMYPAVNHAVRLFQLGARAYLSKTHSASEVVDAIRTVAAGLEYHSEETRSLLRNSTGAPAPHETLSAREYQVFLLLAQGRATLDIAAELNLTPSTISTHTMRIREKLGVQTLGDIIHYAFRVGLVDPP